MKIKLMLAALVLSVFSSSAFSQSVVITPEKVTYKRPKAKEGPKKSFDVIYPKVKAATPALSKKIEDTLSYEKAFPGLNFKEQINEEDSLSNADYDVSYNKNGILDIGLWYDAVTTYPSTFRTTIVVNLKTGNRVKPSDIFTNLRGLAAKVRKAQQAEIKKEIAERRKESSEDDAKTIEEYVSNKDFTPENLKHFSVIDKGITFKYDYEFPHVVQSLQPLGDYFYSWKELKPFIKRGGLLARFIR